MKDTERIIDTAIETYPLENLPPGFVRKAMDQIAPQPRFKLTFMDLALPAFFAFFGAIILSISYWILQGLNESWQSELRLPQIIGTPPMTTIFGLVTAAIVCLVILATAILILSLWLEKPIRLQRRIP
jgi:TRAP-type C4-dicarboxylate transport system permease small subunit